MKDINEHAELFCKKCKKNKTHVTKKTFEEYKNSFIMDSYSKLCCGCATNTVFYYNDILTDEQLKIFSPKEITERMKYQIKVKNEKYDFSNTDMIISITLRLISQLSKTDILILNSLIDLKNYDSDEILVNQSEIAKALFLKQPNVARSLKKLIELKFINKIEDNKYTIDFLEKFNSFREFE